MSHGNKCGFFGENRIQTGNFVSVVEDPVDVPVVVPCWLSACLSVFVLHLLLPLLNFVLVEECLRDDNGGCGDHLGEEQDQQVSHDNLTGSLKWSVACKHHYYLADETGKPPDCVNIAE